MRLLLYLAGSFVGSWVLIAAVWPRKRDVSRDWLVDSERRQWREGYDGVPWKWPVKP